METGSGESSKWWKMTRNEYDPRFPTDAGFQKMQVTHKLSNGSSITIHYQYNSNTGKAYDIKITTPQRVTADPNDVINSIKDKIK